MDELSSPMEVAILSHFRRPITHAGAFSSLQESNLSFRRPKWSTGVPQTLSMIPPRRIRTFIVGRSLTSPAGGALGMYDIKGGRAESNRHHRNAHLLSFRSCHLSYCLIIGAASFSSSHQKKFITYYPYGPREIRTHIRGMTPVFCQLNYTSAHYVGGLFLYPAALGLLLVSNSSATQHRCSFSRAGFYRLFLVQRPYQKA